MSSKGRDDVDVAIVGYGPVGALTAMMLGAAGLRVAVLERSTEPVTLPRAVGLDGESMRTFARLGHGKAVSDILQPPREYDGIQFTNSKREPHFQVDFPAFGPNGWRDIAFFDQPELEALLRELVAKDHQIDVRMGSEVTALAQDATGVDLTIRDVASGEEPSLRAAFVVGSDGASSFVRRAVGIDWISLGYDHDWLVVDITVDDVDALPLVSMQVCDPDRLVSYICVKDPNRRWELQLQPGETREAMLKTERIEELLQSWLTADRYTVRRAAVYQFHAATAAEWKVGRVLLAGDAAHQTPPFLGQGLNAGLRDAANLGWKLPLVLSGKSGAEMLDSYGRERDAHARDLVVDAVGIGKLMETLAAREAGLPDPHPPSDQGSPAGRGMPPLRDGVLVLEQTAPNGSAGLMLRQPRVRRPDGSICLLDELYGQGFAVVARERSDLEMSEVSRKRLQGLAARLVCLEDVAVVEGALDPLLDEGGAVIVRPDRYIFGSVDQDWSLDRLVEELHRKLVLV